MEFSVKKSTKFVQLGFVLTSGVHISGELHVPADISSGVRPSDILKPDEFIGLVNAVIRSKGGEIREVEYLQLAPWAIAWIEFPPLEGAWKRGKSAPPAQGHRALNL